MGWWIEQKHPNQPMYVDKAVPVRIVAAITIIAATLDLFADVILCVHLSREVYLFGCTAKHTAYCFFFFTGVSVLVYVMELVEAIITLKNNQETLWLSRLVKSLCLTMEEVPLPLCLLIIFANEPNTRLASPAKIASAIKLVALIWGIVKFIKMRFCWFFYPCNGGHGYHENVRRCFIYKWWRVAMVIVNICHIISIILCIINIIMASKERVPNHQYTPCDSDTTWL